MRRFLCLLLDLFLIFVVGFVFTLWFWYLRPYNPLEIIEPVKILNEDKTVIAGQLLYYEVSFVKNTDIKPVITRRLIDGISFDLPSASPNNKTGANTKTPSIQIPGILPAGDYVLESTACYQMNPVREICIIYSTVLIVTGLWILYIIFVKRMQK